MSLESVCHPRWRLCFPSLYKDKNTFYKYASQIKHADTITGTIVQKWFSLDFERVTLVFNVTKIFTYYDHY